MIDLKAMTLDELKAYRAEVEKMIETHCIARKNELVSNLLAAAEALREEFPEISSYMEIQCPECDCYVDVDPLDCLIKMSNRDFHI